MRKEIFLSIGFSTLLNCQETFLGKLLEDIIFFFFICFHSAFSHLLQSEHKSTFQSELVFSQHQRKEYSNTDYNIT